VGLLGGPDLHKRVNFSCGFAEAGVVDVFSHVGVDESEGVTELK
jgi:hypothetical protein